MQHRHLVRATSFEPDALRAIFRAFDDAWGEIAPKIRTEPIAVERARTSLAGIVLGLAANTEPTAPNGLRALAVTVFCAKHRIEGDGGARPSR